MLTWSDFKTGFISQLDFSKWLTTVRWFRGKARRVLKIQIMDGVMYREWALCLIRVFYADGQETYFIPCAVKPEAFSNNSPLGIIKFQGMTYSLHDACLQKGFQAWFAGELLEGRSLPLESGRLIFATMAKHPLNMSVSQESVSNLGTEQSNTSFVLQSEYIIKIYRQVEDIPNPEVEMLLTLGAKGFDSIPKLEAYAFYESQSGKRSSVAIMQPFLSNQGDGWDYVLSELRALAEKKVTSELSTKLKLRGFVSHALADHFRRLYLLGQTIGRMHYILNIPGEDPAVSPRTCTLEHIAYMQAQFADQHKQTLDLVAAQLDQTKDIKITSQFMFLLSQRAKIIAQGCVLHILQNQGCDLIRYHGDFHLGQVLNCGKDWVIFDFEGEPLRPAAERRRHTCPLKDVAGLLRSLNYAAEVFAGERPANKSLATAWETMARQVFLEGYWQETFAKKVRFLPKAMEDILSLTRFFELEKALYELQYEINNRPEWIRVPLAGSLRLLKDDKENMDQMDLNSTKERPAKG